MAEDDQFECRAHSVMWVMTIYSGDHMCSHFIAQIDIYDWDEYKLYLDGYDKIHSKYNGEVLAVDSNPSVLEGKWPYTRAVIIRFQNHAETMRWYKSEEYQQLVKHRHKSSKADIILVKGRK